LSDIFGQNHEKKDENRKHRRHKHRHRSHHRSHKPSTERTGDSDGIQPPIEESAPEQKPKEDSTLKRKKHKRKHKHKNSVDVVPKSNEETAKLDSVEQQPPKEESAPKQKKHKRKHNTDPTQQAPQESAPVQKKHKRKHRKEQTAEVVPVEPVHPPQEESVPEQSTKHPERHKHRHKHRKIGEQVAKSDTVVPTAPEKTEIIQPPQIKRKKGKEQVQASIETTENSQENSELKEFNLEFRCENFELHLWKVLFQEWEKYVIQATLISTLMTASLGNFHGTLSEMATTIHKTTQKKHVQLLSRPTEKTLEEREKSSKKEK